MDLVAIGHDGFDLAACLSYLMRTGFVGEGRFGQRAEDFGPRESLAFSIGPGEPGVEQLRNGRAIARCSGLHKCAVGLDNGCFLHRRNSPLEGLREQEAETENACSKHTGNGTSHALWSSLARLSLFGANTRPEEVGPFLAWRFRKQQSLKDKLQAQLDSAVAAGTKHRVKRGIIRGGATTAERTGL